MPCLFLPDSAKAVLKRVLDKHNREVEKRRKRLAYGGKKGRSARRVLKRIGDFLYPHHEDVAAYLTGIPR